MEAVDDLIWGSELHGLGVRGIYFWEMKGCYVIQRDGNEFAHNNMIYVFAGRLRVDTPTIEADIGPGQLLTFPSRIPRRLTMESQSAIGLHLRIDESAESGVKFPGLVVRDASESSAVHSVVNQILRERDGLQLNRETAIRQLVALLAIYVERDLQILYKPGAQYYRRQLDELWNRVRLDLAHRWTVEQLAQRARVSPSYLFQLCREIYNVTPMAYVNQLRLKQAKSLLKLTSLDLSQIAEQVGYGSAYAFSNAFFRQVGIRPGRFRKMHADRAGGFIRNT